MPRTPPRAGGAVARLARVPQPQRRMEKASMSAKDLSEAKAILKQLTANAVSESAEQKRAANWRAGLLERAHVELGQPADVIDRAHAGDTEARAVISTALDRAPGFVAREGDFMARTEEALLNATSSGDWTLRESRKRTLRAMVQ